VELHALTDGHTKTEGNPEAQEGSEEENKEGGQTEGHQGSEKHRTRRID